MLFNSLDFFLFFAVVCLWFFRGPLWLRAPLTLAGIVWPLYAEQMSGSSIGATLLIVATFAAVVVIRRRGDDYLARKVLLTSASLLFYAAWKWPYTVLMLISTLLDYWCSINIQRTEDPKRRKLFLMISVVGNLGSLFFFKYTNWMLDSVETALSWFGVQADLGPLPIILPLGISFYTFQIMSYTIDVYRRDIDARKSMLDVMLYVTFFPQLVAGPILRGADFMIELAKRPTFDLTRAKEGILQMIWGLAKKLLIADALCGIVDMAYGRPDQFSGPGLLLATYAFAFQIYGDFSGYSDVAIGASKVLGYHIPPNFERPYFATNLTTFWRRWHISLSSWLRDYLYIVLGGSRGNRARTLFNLMATMVLGGLWHGASWNFVIWGAINGAVLALHRLWMWQRGIAKATDDQRPLHWLVFATLNFHIVCLCWVFFRADTFATAVAVLKGIFTWQPGLMVPTLFPFAIIPALLAAETGWERWPALRQWVWRPNVARWLIYAGVAGLILLVTSVPPQSFIYFVF